MKRFAELTKYISLIDQDEIGHWYIDRENDGTMEYPIQLPYVVFSKMINNFVDDVYTMVDRFSEWELNQYGKILEENGLRWESKSMSGAIVEDLDARCICALLVAAVRAERFCDGALMSFFKDGSILRWLQRLDMIDAEQHIPLKRIQISSDGICYGPCPGFDEEVEQRLILHRDGRVWFTGYNFGNGIKHTKSRRQQFKIPQEKMNRLFDAFDHYFSNDPQIMRACDAGMWDMVLTDAEGKTTQFRGSMTSSCEMDNPDLSALTREIISVEDLWVFGRKYKE